MSTPNSGMTDMTSGSPIKHILRFSIPLLIGNIFQQAYNLVDSVVVGNFTGKEAMAAVNTSFPVLFLMIALFAGLGMGATVMLSQYFGAGDMESVKKTVSTVSSSMLIVSIPLTAIGMLLSTPLLRLLGVPDDTFAQAQLYLIILFAGVIGSFGFNINSGILQGLGDSKSPLRFLIVACVLNIVLDLALVFPMGVAGVALATIIAQTFSWLYGVYYIRRKYPELEYNPIKIRVDGKLLKRIVTLGLPLGLQQTLFSIGILLLQKLINSYGSSFMAGFSAANKIDSFIFLPVISFSSALITFTGQNIGAGRLDRVRQGLRSTLLVSALTCGAITAIVLPLGRSLLWLFNRDPEVIAAGMAYLLRVVPFFMIIMVQFMLTSVLRGAGATMVSLITTLVALCLVRVPTAYYFAERFGRDSMFFSFACGWAVGFVIALAFYLQGGWKTKRITSSPPSEMPDPIPDTALPDTAAVEGAAVDF